MASRRTSVPEDRMDRVDQTVSLHSVVHSRNSLHSMGITIEESARMNAAGIRGIDGLLGDNLSPTSNHPDPDKIKSKAKKSHATLKKLKMENFEHSELKLKKCSNIPILDSYSVLSTNSSGSSGEGTLTGWTPLWSLDSGGKSTGERILSPLGGGVSARPSIRCIKGCCFLRGSSTVVVTEPQSGSVKIFSKRKGRPLGSINGGEITEKTDWGHRNKTATRRFLPTGISETENDGVVAVTDRSRLYYLRIDGSQSTVEAEIEIKNRVDIVGIACTNLSKMIILDPGHTNKAFVGCCDSSGKVIREFKGNISKPSFIAWNDYYQVAAIVDCGNRSVLLYDTDSKLLNSFEGASRSTRGLSYPTGICWTPHSQLMVADRAEGVVLSYDLRMMKSENALDATDGLRDPMVLACDRMSRYLLVTEEEFQCGGKDVFRLKAFKRSGVSKNFHDSLF